MSASLPVVRPEPLSEAALVALGDQAPSLERLFLFSRDAELRVHSLRMTIEERSATARGEEVLHHEVLLRNPGRARVTTRRSNDPLSRDFEVWIGDGDTVRTYRAADRLASVRAARGGVVGAESAGLPAWARTRPVLTALPAGSLADAFVHPHSLFRNVLVTGPLSVLGTTTVAGREAIVVRSSHPRTAKVLVDRPDRWVDVGIDRSSGFILLLSEHVGEAETRRGEVSVLDLDADIPDEAFELHLGSDVRMLY
jgi:hypothetical protein